LASTLALGSQLWPALTSSLGSAMML